MILPKMRLTPGSPSMIGLMGPASLMELGGAKGLVTMNNACPLIAMVLHPFQTLKTNMIHHASPMVSNFVVQF